MNTHKPPSAQWSLAQPVKRCVKLAVKMDSAKVSIEPLDVDNYAVWSQTMQLLLTHKKLWKGVTDPEGDEDRTDEAKALIGLHVRPPHLGAILAAKNAKEAWDLLERTGSNSAVCSIRIPTVPINQKVKTVPTVWGQEYVKKAFEQVFRDKGTIHEDWTV